MADRCTRRFGSGLKQSCKLMQHPSERAPLPVAINHHQLNYSHALPPHCFRPRKTRDASRQIARLNRSIGSPLRFSPRDRYFSSIFHPVSRFFRFFQRSNLIPDSFFERARLIFDSVANNHRLLSSIRSIFRNIWNFRFLLRRMRLFFEIISMILNSSLPPHSEHYRLLRYSSIFTPNMFVSSCVKTSFYLSLFYIYIYIFPFTRERFFS